MCQPLRCAPPASWSPGAPRPCRSGPGRCARGGREAGRGPAVELGAGGLLVQGPLLCIRSFQNTAPAGQAEAVGPFGSGSGSGPDTASQPCPTVILPPWMRPLPIPLQKPTLQTPVLSDQCLGLRQPWDCALQEGPREPSPAVGDRRAWTRRFFLPADLRGSVPPVVLPSPSAQHLSRKGSLPPPYSYPPCSGPTSVSS